MSATTRQHAAVGSLAIVITVDFNGSEVVTLRSRKATATSTDWWKYDADHTREFASLAEAKAVALTVCPIFHGSAGPVAQFCRVRVDAWNGWTSF